MRIVQLVTRRQRRGAEIFAAQLSDALTKRGHAVTLVGLYEPASPGVTPEHADYCDLGIKRRRVPSVRGVKALGGLLARLSPDLVQANASDTLEYSALCRMGRQTLWRLVYRNASLSSPWLRWRFQRTLGRLWLRQVDHVVSVSQNCKRDFLLTYGVLDGHVSVIPIGTPVGQYRARRAGKAGLVEIGNVPEEAEVVAVVGALVPEKNHLWMLDAFARISHARPSAYLIVIGEGPLRPRIETKVHQLGLEQRVRLLGSRSDAAVLLAGADLLVLPSVIEGLPGVILEAAAAGIPCVASRVGGVPEAVVEGETGIMVPPGDMMRFCEATLGLLGDTECRHRMGEAARDLVHAKYGLDRIVDQFESCYHGLLRSRDGH
jgi:glycosyltransferase involved in cell wall biosynthesis